MNYTLNQLHIFLKIVQTKSVTKAADELHLTQPAVSIQLKNFQDNFEIPLTEVVGRKIYITDFGHEIALAAEEILNQVQAINFKTLAHKGQLTGKLKIAVVSTGKYVMPYFLSQFLNQNQGVELMMDVTNKNKVIESLENNEVDFALVSILPSTLKVEHLDLLSNKLFLIGNNKTENVTSEIFNEVPIIFREKGSGTRQTMEKYFEQQQIPVVKKMELTSNEAVKQAVQAGLGYSIMPLIGLKNEILNKELHIVHVNGLPITTTWQLIWLESKKHSPAAAAYLNYVKAEKEKIASQFFDWIDQY